MWEFDQYGNLPKGVHRAALEEINEIFGASSARRKWLMENLERIIELAKSTNKLERVIIWGSFVSNKELPQDIDLLLIMREDFALEKINPEAKILFAHLEGRITFNADIFWTKSSIGTDTINLWLDTYQMTKDFKPRGIVEVIIK